MVFIAEHPVLKENPENTVAVGLTFWEREEKGVIVFIWESLKKPLWSGTQEVSAETFSQLDFDDLTDTIAATPVNAAKLGYETPPTDSFIKYISA